MGVDRITACPACGKALPGGTAYRRGAGVGLRDKRELSCPYCRSPLEPLRWTSLVPLFVILAVSIAARELIGPLLEWNVILILLALAACYHFVEIRSMWRQRREKQRRRALGQYVEEIDRDDN